ncbi:hypothetical protein CMQ_3294 [Grosmannia clavigera kw1407]|uniref:Uncharacterized protein n=1 Tax=Grosmannia clavigera (strain kw1407 / UAMH 11150) TaxID=655863 RepID=F0X8N7_GROCL|nr:uncharacterized protein CMQ_3294 [Grosmannia clavigera kw1407]EFX05225.1 hypothetical protein CMQ_3294 [Grosmannia clavigera kw1407]
MGSQAASLQFGVEIELLLGSRKKAYGSWSALAKDVSKRLLKAGINNHINEGGSRSAENYSEWSIVQEVTIPSQPANNLWGIELVSPVYPAAWYWAGDIDAVFAAVHGAFMVVASPHCSTHVHVSATPAPLSTVELGLLAKAVLYFEPALDGLAPTVRRSSSTYWCQSNRVSQAFRDQQGLDSCFSIIDAAVDSAAVAGEVSATRAVVEAINLFPAGSAYGRAHGKKHDFVRGKAFKWDFSGMLPKSAGCGTGLGTVEFRQPPGSTAADEACAWVTLALTFVAGVTAVGDFGVDNVDAGASPAELWNVLHSGAAFIGWEGLGTLEHLFGSSSSDSDN